MDVGDQAGPQVVERLLAAPAEADDRGALGEAGDDEGDGGDRGTSAPTKPTSHAAVVGDALVDRLLDEDRHDDPTGRPDRGEAPRERQPLAQHRRLLQAAVDRVDGREAADRLIHCRHHPPPPTASGVGLAVGLERLDEGAVAGAARHQLVVRAVVDDLARRRGTRPRRRGRSSTAARRPSAPSCRRTPRAGWPARRPRSPGRAPTSCRRAAAAPGRRTSARARATRWRWPPLRLTPRSPTTVSRPCGVSATKSSARASRSASHSLLVVDRLRRARCCGGSSRRTGTPPGTRSPAAPARLRRGPWSAATSPATISTSVVLPAPVGPTTATMRPAATSSDDVVERRRGPRRGT